MTTAEVSYVSVLRALCRSITTNETIRVKGRQEGYRCKATYSLVPQLHVSPLSMKRVNDVALAVGNFCANHSRLTALAPDFFFEVCVKVNRSDQYMVKLSFMNRNLLSSSAKTSDSLREDGCALHEDAVAAALSVPVNTALCGQHSTRETLFDVWQRSTEPHKLEDHLRALYPNLVALVAHVRLPAARSDCDSNRAETHPVAAKDVLHSKPDKSSTYVPLTRDGATAMVEYTPNGHPFWLSADSFCEVNHEMETAIYAAIVEFLRLSTPCTDNFKKECNTAPVLRELSETLETTPQRVALADSHLSRRVFICGRDVNSVVRTFEEYYDSTTVVTTCPCVFADTKLNNISHCIRCAKDQIAEPLRAFAASRTGNGDSKGGEDVSDIDDNISSKEKFNNDTSHSAESHCLITAGRHGLHPSTTTALSELGAAGLVTDLIYVSCNVDSLTRDVHVLKEAWYIAHARTFDFFPGTDYVMTVLHLRPWTKRTAGSTPGGDLLVLPVGVPGTGKSTCGRALDSFFRDATRDGADGVQSTTKASTRAPQKKKAKQDGTAACFVPRTYLTLPRHAVVFRHVERDELFHQARSATSSLKATKQKTHEALVRALGSWTEDLEKAEADVSVSGSQAAFPRRRVLYLDSTNGSAEARALYASLWDTTDGSHFSKTIPMPASCVTLFFDAPDDLDELLRRVRSRGLHPSFPGDPEEQQRKLSVIAAAVACKDDESMKDTESAGNGSTATARVAWPIRASGKVDAALDTIQEVVLTVSAHLLFSCELAYVLRADALQLLCQST